jgi:hypothetical protein
MLSILREHVFNKMPRGFPPADILFWRGRSPAYTQPSPSVESAFLAMQWPLSTECWLSGRAPSRKNCCRSLCQTPSTRDAPAQKKRNRSPKVCLIPFSHLQPTMSPIAALRTAARVGPARLVAGMRVSLAARPMVARMAPSTVTRAFSASAGRFGSGTSECSFACSVWPLGGRAELAQLCACVS